MSLEDDMRRRLADLDARGLLRRPITLEGPERATGRVGGREIVVFCSNDYLGLGAHPSIVAAARDGLDQHGLGAGASRLISGTTRAHRAAEAACARLVGCPAALMFSTGYAANVGALSTLVGRGDVVFSDRLNHASLIDGIRMSRAAVHIFEHRDSGHLERLLVSHRSDGCRAFIVTDSLFSMDGSLADLPGLRALADAHDAAFFVDEAHALGVMGGGRGWSHECGVTPDVLVGTLGKAAGVAGAFVAGSRALRQLLENRARSYVFSTAPPAALAEAVREAIEKILVAGAARERVFGYAAQIREALRGQGWTIPEGRTPIVPVIVGGAARAMDCSARLLERGYFVQGIRPPTVPRGTSRLRVVPSAAHTEAQVDGLIAAFAELADRPSEHSHPPAG